MDCDDDDEEDEDEVKEDDTLRGGEVMGRVASTGGYLYTVSIVY